MKRKILSLFIMIAFNAIALSQNANSNFISIQADSLLVGIEKYNHQKIVTEGYIVHVCGVDGKKMKLRTPGGAIIKIVPHDSTHCFNRSYYKKNIRVKGIIKGKRFKKSYIKKVKEEGKLLCHIDHTPCKDTAWVKSQIEAGRKRKLLEKDIKKLTILMQKQGGNCFYVVIIYANEIKVLNP